jgi:small subunit ribosomal protein S7
VYIVANRIIREGKKNLSYNILYSSLNQIKEKTKRDPLVVFEYAIRKVTPKVQVKVRRVGGTNYQVPGQVSLKKGTAVAIQWILKATNNRPRHNIATRLSEEILDSARGNSRAVRKREEVHRIADANKAFTRYQF